MALPAVVMARALPYGSTFPIGVVRLRQTHSAVVYSTISNTYLDVWQDDRNFGTPEAEDIFGQIVNADGTLSGANIAIATAPNDQLTPEMAWDSANNQYLVVWADNRNTTTT